MSSKKEEKAAFEKLKKAFPDKGVSLDFRQETWYEKPYYKAYHADLGFSSEYATASEAVDEIIKKGGASKEEKAE